MVCGVVVAAGQGTRIGFRKQYARLGGVPMWHWSVEALFRGGVDRVWLVVPPADLDRIRAEIRGDSRWAEMVQAVPGGQTRAHSVANGVQAILLAMEDMYRPPGTCDGGRRQSRRRPDPDAAVDRAEDLQSVWIAVHDAARPFVSPEDVRHVVEAAKAGGGAILAEGCVDTIKRVNADAEICETLPRHELWRAQTPQVFAAAWFADALAQGMWDPEATDEAAVFERMGYRVRVVPASGLNMKVTTTTDWEFAQWWAQRQQELRKEVR